MVVCVTFSKLHWSAMKVKSVASKSCCKGATLSKSTGHPVHMEVDLTTQIQNIKRREDEEIFMCAPDLNETYNHSVHKEFIYLYIFAYYVQLL